MFKKAMPYLFSRQTALLLASFAAIAAFSSEVEKAPSTTCLDGKKHYRAAIRHIESGGIGYDEGYTTFETFFSSEPTRWIVTPFFDARGHIFDNGRWAANAGIGLRALWGKRVYGINTYYDYRNTHRLHCNQIGVGLETLGKIFDFRINGYLPVGKKTSNPYGAIFGAFSGHRMLISQKYQTAMKGADAEFGFHFRKSSSKNMDFYAAAGPYYYIGEIGPNTWGGKVRISGTYKDIVSLELSDSYDKTFHNNFQGQISLNFSFGPRSKVKAKEYSCEMADALNGRMVQPVARQEIIVVDKKRKNSVAIDPATGLPYFFVFVNNMSRSNGTFESPYPTLTLAQANSSPNDVIYVFPGNGTTSGMDSGIFLKANQKFWGSGVSHLIQTSQGGVSIPAQTGSSPSITNTNVDTEGNAITLAANNAISGFTITSAINDAIFGTDPQSLDVSFCTFENISTFAIEASFPSIGSVSITNNQLLNNVNGIGLTFNGTATLHCSDNMFKGQSSVSNVPLEISADGNSLTAHIENNTFDANTTGGVRVSLNNALDVDIILLNNTITNSGTGAQSTLGSSFVIIPNGTTNNCSVLLKDNTFSSNNSNSFYLHTSGAFTSFGITAITNTMSNNGGSALVFGSGCTNFTLNALRNTLSNLNDNGIGIVGGPSFQTANITINGNTISDIGNGQNAIAISQGSSILNFTIKNNTINRCVGSGILCFSSEFTNMNANIEGNTIGNCIGMGNAASAISLDNYLNLTSSVANNIFSDNAAPSVALGFFSSGNPTVCLNLNGNSSNVDPSYSLTNPGSGAFNLSPCNASAVNTGAINSSGTITPVQACPGAAPCP